MKRKRNSKDPSRNTKRTNYYSDGKHKYIIDQNLLNIIIQLFNYGNQ